VVLSFATFIHLSLVIHMRPDVLSVFFIALTFSSLLTIPPLAVLWLLDRRERGICRPPTVNDLAEILQTTAGPPPERPPAVRTTGYPRSGRSP
jgi:hypothetical protein